MMEQHEMLGGRFDGLRLWIPEGMPYVNVPIPVTAQLLQHQNPNDINPLDYMTYTINRDTKLIKREQR